MKLISPNSLSKLLLTLYCLLTLSATAQETDSAYQNINQSLTVPVRFFVLSSQISQLDADISQQEIASLLVDVNLIWNQANIQFELESIVSLKASVEQRYLAAIDPGSSLTARERALVMIEVCTLPILLDSVLNLCVVGHMSDNRGGVAFGIIDHLPIIVWPVEIAHKKYLNPATLAHEFGHFLGLEHNAEEDIFLMRGGGNNMRRIGNFEGIKLTADEISASRETAVFVIEQAP